MSRKKSGNSIRHGGWTNILRGGPAYVSIFCRGDDSAPHDKWRIGALQPAEHHGEHYWTESVSGYADHDNPHYFRTHPAITQYLVGDRWLTEPEQTFHSDDPTFRARWAVKCPKCGFGRTFADTRQYSGAIDQLAALRSDDGVFEVSLRGFVSHLTGNR